MRNPQIRCKPRARRATGKRLDVAALETKYRSHRRYVVAQHRPDNRGIDVLVVMNDAVACPDGKGPVDAGKFHRVRPWKASHRFTDLGDDVLGCATCDP